MDPASLPKAGSDLAIIRPARLADVPAITAIYAPHVRHGFASWEFDPPDEEEMARRMQSLLLAPYPYPYLVAEQEAVVLGYAYAGPYRPRPGYRYAVEDSIYLRPEAQGQGLGRRLLGSLLEAATQAGFRQMIAMIGDSQNHGSVALHRRLGFAHIGTMPQVGFKAGRWLDCVIMQRSLGAASDL